MSPTLTRLSDATAFMLPSGFVRKAVALAG